MKEGILRNTLAMLLRPFVALGHSLHIVRPQVILKIDGGIASQMHFYLVGEWLRRNRGLDVVYDLVWFDEVGRDINGEFVRNFDLLRLSPGLPFPISRNGVKVSLYRLLYKHCHDVELAPETWQRLGAPAYLCGYYSHFPKLYSDMRRMIPMNPRDVDEVSRALAVEMANEPNSVGMHVRRGDLKVYLPFYGAPTDPGYFARAVNKLRELHGSDIPVYIFSDEPEWVRSELIPHMPAGRYRVVDHNGSDKGYIDLWLLSRCRHFVASAGSFGRFAALLSERGGDLVMPCTPEMEQWREHFPDAMMI